MTTKVISSPENWIESNAIEQLNQTSLLPGMRQAIGMPDLHPGKGTPIGAVFACDGFIYPHLVGNDIGCGMGFWQTDLTTSEIRLDKWVKKLTAFESMGVDACCEQIASAKLAPTNFDNSLGTIGGGNHFAELQGVQDIVDPVLFADFGIAKDDLYVLVHSGSRGLGENILQTHQKQFGNAGHEAASIEAHDYLANHDNAVKWAQLNRQIIATKFMGAINTRGRQLLDVCHNGVHFDRQQSCWLHRKGAAPSDQGPVVIPGSRGTLSYLVVARGDQTTNLATLAHGAGRKWKRSECRGKLEKRYSNEDLKRTELGGRVICEDKALLYEEAPQAYKDIDVVVGDLVSAGLVSVIATLAPLITYKTGVIKR